jgi:hypothetical protein
MEIKTPAGGTWRALAPGVRGIELEAKEEAWTLASGRP